MDRRYSELAYRFKFDLCESGIARQGELVYFAQGSSCFARPNQFT